MWWERFQAQMWTMFGFLGLMIATYIWVREGFLHNHAILVLFFSAYAWTMSYSAASKRKMLKKYDEEEALKWEKFKADEKAQAEKEKEK